MVRTLAAQYGGGTYVKYANELHTPGCTANAIADAASSGSAEPCRLGLERRASLTQPNANQAERTHGASEPNAGPRHFFQCRHNQWPTCQAARMATQE